MGQLPLADKPSVTWRIVESIVESNNKIKSNQRYMHGFSISHDPHLLKITASFVLDPWAQGLRDQINGSNTESHRSNKDQIMTLLVFDSRISATADRARENGKDYQVCQRLLCWELQNCHIR